MVVRDGTPTGVISGPVKLSLSITPNPFRHETGIALTAPVGSPVIVTIHDVGGRLVRRLMLLAGGSLRWDGRDGNGREVASGIYIVRATAGNSNVVGSRLVARLR